MAGPSKTSKIPGLKSGKVRQYITLGVVLGLLYLGLYLIFATSDNNGDQTAAKKAEIATTHIRAPGEQVDPRDRWIGGAGATVAEHAQRLNKAEQDQRALLARFQKLEEELRNRQPVAPSTTTTTSSPITTESSMPEAIVAPAAPSVREQVALAQPSVFPPGTPGQTASTLANAGGVLQNWMGGGTAGSQPEVPPIRALGHFKVSPTTSALAGGGATSGQGAPKTAGSTASAAAKPTASERQAGQTFLPVGFVRAELLSGLDAPTGGQAQSHPLPVMMRITDLGVLPNHYRANLKECFAVGAGYGDIAAERAYIRVETLSCIRHDGQVLEIKAQGHVFDETGMLGMRGHVRNKQGQILANALLAGVVSGIGQGIQYQSTTSTVTPVGNTVTQPSAGKEFEAGMASGMGRALDRLANYYIGLAEKIFPVIEVQARRRIDIAFTKGVTLDVPLPDLTMGYYHED